MNRLAPPLPVLLAVLCLSATALSAQGTGDGAGDHPRAVTLGAHGVVERGQGVAGQAGQGQWRGFPLSLSLRDAALPEVLRAFAEIAGFNLVLDPRVQGTVTVELQDVPWDLALHVILKIHGLGAEVDGRLSLIAPPR